MLMLVSQQKSTEVTFRRITFRRNRNIGKFYEFHSLQLCLRDVTVYDL